MLLFDLSLAVENQVCYPKNFRYTKTHMHMKVDISMVYYPKNIRYTKTTDAEEVILAKVYYPKNIRYTKTSNLGECKLLCF